MAIVRNSLCRFTASIIWLFLLSRNRELHVTASFNVYPVWNASAIENGSEPCFLAPGNFNEHNATMLSGNGDKTCSVQITTSTETRIMIEIPDGTPLDTFLYIEKQGNLTGCPNRYALITPDGPCSFAFAHTHVQIFLQGNTSILISSVSVNKMVNQSLPMYLEITPDDKDAAEMNVCQANQFNHTISCTAITNQHCIFELPPDCSATLDYGQIYFNCSDNEFHSSHSALIVYPVDILALDFSDGSLVEINVYAFRSLKSLQELDLSYNRLEKLYTEIFEGLEMLNYLNLEYNTLKVLPRGLFNGLINLEALDIAANQISSVDGNLFKETYNLKYINLNHNELSSLPIGLFNNLNDLETLVISANQISSVEEGLFRDTNNLIRLSLSRNKLGYLPRGLFRGLIKLKELYLYSNQIRLLEVGLFNGLSSLEVLYLYENQISVVHTGVFDHLINLERLYLGANRISSLGKGLFNETGNLVHLNLEKNRLTGLPRDVFNGLNNLGELYLHDNQIGFLDTGLFGQMSYLWHLSLHINNVTLLPSGLFNGLINLRYLSLYANQISSITSDLFTYTKALINLSLVGNKLTSLPPGMFKGLSNLETLLLNENHISTIGDDLFSETLALTSLALNYNNLSVLPNGLCNGLVHLAYLNLDGNQIRQLDTDFFNETPRLTQLYLSMNGLHELPKHLFRGLRDLRSLFLNHNEIRQVNGTLFQEIPQLEILSLERNYITQLPYDLFWTLQFLTTLVLRGNLVSNLNHTLFAGLGDLEILDLAFNRIRVLDARLFSDTVNLHFVEFSGNQLTNIPDLSELDKLVMFGIRENVLTMVDDSSFLGISKQTELFVTQTEICECYIPSGIDCTALGVRSPYLTCERLLSDRLLMVLMWVIGVNALTGNMFVLIQTKRRHKKTTVQPFLLSNLAISDLLMGCYMIIIAAADLYFGETFPMKAEAWRTGITCRIAGAISMISSEASVFFVTLISIDRFINIRFPFSSRKLTKKSSTIVVASIWLIALATGIVPSVLSGENFKFYENSNVCIGLPLVQVERFSKDVLVDKVPLITLDYIAVNWNKYAVQSDSLGRVPGLYYASAMFLGLNGISYVIILLCYIDIVRVVFRSSKRAGLNKDLKEQIKLTAKVVVIVLTDFLCWAPVIVMGILVQFEVLILPPSVYAWCVAVVLPINSAINPYLYTIAGIISDRRKQARNTSRHSKLTTGTSNTNLDIPLANLSTAGKT